MSETPCPFCGQIHGDDMSECADGFTSRHNDEYASLKAERDALLAEHELGVCPVCHMRSTSGYYRDEHGLGHVCKHAYHTARYSAERVIYGE